MQELKDCTALRQQLQEIGCVLDFSVFALDGEDGADAATHRAAALHTLRTLQRDSDAYFERLLRRPEYAARRREEFFRMHVDAAALGVGELLDTAEFLGPLCDLARGALLLRGEENPGRDDLYWYGDAEIAANRVRAPELRGDGGLAYAYLYPPYNLHADNAVRNGLFFELLDHLIGGRRGDYVIRRWSAASSNYFDAGREWWGTYFWTVYPHGTRRIVGIAGSSTD
ncbi:hypothetical protein [Tahibacter harae]|uniref:Uncharacterized protein n=1 Tax=Tahibacter harae TaxID=2963937 RepID=A0ABT1QVL7_9GAMM|nr:hypothetical protein [Tahibacter harae]MCQ4166324.1 hypothetical protein [Tahibacter harae]